MSSHTITRDEHNGVPRGLQLQQTPLASALQNSADMPEMQYPQDDFGDGPRDYVLAHLDGGTGECPLSFGTLPTSIPNLAVTSRRPRTRGGKKGLKPQHGVPSQHPIGARPPPADDQQETGTMRHDGRPEAPRLLPLCSLASTTSQGAISPSNKSGEARARTSCLAKPEPSMDILETWPREATTCMLRHIPNRYTAEEVLAEMLAVGFEGAFDFFYLPIDFSTKRNRGYSFINFRDAADAWRFVQSFHGGSLTRYATQKVLEVSPALKQGFEANVAQYVNKDAQRIQNPWFRPMIFANGNDRALASIAAS
mmetsp:Transcript_101275/g.201229  ORF Transcript_101275/g.201229 Transcript_101275/m.201229 type:complete len:310 (-) Transcript_101275:427-1356(-)